MSDPWPATVQMLLGASAVPAVHWPAERCRVVMARDMLEPIDPDLPPLPPEPRTIVTDEAVLHHLTGAGTTTVRTAAAELAIPKSSVARALQRMRDRGLVRLTVDGWRAAA